MNIIGILIGLVILGCIYDVVVGHLMCAATLILLPIATLLKWTADGVKAWTKAINEVKNSM